MQTQERSPTPTQADGRGPALERAIWGHRSHSQECESREASEITLLQNVTTSPRSPSAGPLSAIPETCGLVASGTHSAFSWAVATPAGASNTGFCLTNSCPPRCGSSNSPWVQPSPAQLPFPRKNKPFCFCPRCSLLLCHSAILALTSLHCNDLFRCPTHQRRKGCLTHQPQPTPGTSQAPNHRCGTEANPLI